MQREHGDPLVGGSRGLDPDPESERALLARGNTIEVTNLPALVSGDPGIVIPLGFAPTSIAVSGRLVAVGAERGIIALDVTDTP